MFEGVDSKPEQLRDIFSEIEYEEIITDVDRAAIVLTFEGIKPVSEVSLYREFAQNPEEFEDHKKRILDNLSKLGLFWKEEKESQGEDFLISFLIAKKKEDLDRMNELITRGNEPTSQYYLEVGKLFGYPDTAVNEFSESDNLLFDEMDQLDAEGQLILRHFINLRLSKKHWKEELEVIKNNCLLIKKHMPSFYERVVTSPELEMTQEVFKDIFVNKEYKKHEELIRRVERYLKRFNIKEIHNPETGEPISTESISTIILEDL